MTTYTTCAVGQLYTEEEEEEEEEEEVEEEEEEEDGQNRGLAVFRV